MADLNRFLQKDEGKTSKHTLKRVRRKPTLVTRGKNPRELSLLTKEQLLALVEPLIEKLPGHFDNLTWTRQKLLPMNPRIHPEELATLLDIPLLEAYWILQQAKSTTDQDSSD